MISAFTDVLHVPNLTTDAQMMNVLKQSDAFSRDDLAKLASKLKGRKASIGEWVFSVKRNSSAKSCEGLFSDKLGGWIFLCQCCRLQYCKRRGEDFARLFKLASKLKGRKAFIGGNFFWLKEQFSQDLRRPLFGT